MLSALIDMGFAAAFASVHENGWSTLFGFVLQAKSPEDGRELSIVRFLVSVLEDALTQCCDGLTLFECVQPERPALSLRNTGRWYAYEAYRYSPERHGSYQQDLWYCVLFRSGQYSRHDVPPLPAGPTFTQDYTPQHYRALLYLHSWDMKADPTIFDHPLLSQDPLCDEEREKSPAFREWNISDLSMMEHRMEFATFGGRIREVSSKDESSEGSSEEDTSDLDHSAEDDLSQAGGEWSDGVAEREEEVLGRSEEEWSDDSEEEGGVPIE